MSANRRAEFLGRKEKRDKGKEVAVAAKSVIFTKDDTQRFELLPGKMRGKEVGTLLGKGAFGRVKQALDEKGNILTVKVSRLAGDFPSTFNEYEVLTKLGENPVLVVTEHETAGEQKFHSYLFQRFRKGETLKCFIGNLFENATLNDWHSRFIQLAEVMLKAFGALEALHAKGVWHCDAHTKNFLWDANSQSVEIIDFGNSSYAEMGDSDPSEHNKVSDFVLLCIFASKDVDQYCKLSVAEDKVDKEGGVQLDIKQQFSQLMHGLESLFDTAKNENTKPKEIIQQAKKQLKEWRDELKKQSPKNVQAVGSQAEVKEEVVSPPASSIMPPVPVEIAPSIKIMPSAETLPVDNSPVKTPLTEIPKVSNGRIILNIIANFFKSLGQKIANFFCCCFSHAVVEEDNHQVQKQKLPSADSTRFVLQATGGRVVQEQKSAAEEPHPVKTFILSASSRSQRSIAPACATRPPHSAASVNHLKSPAV